MEHFSFNSYKKVKCMADFFDSLFIMEEKGQIMIKKNHLPLNKVGYICIKQ